MTDIGPVRLWQVKNKDAGTGCAGFISDAGMRAGIDVPGGGPASRDTSFLNRITAAQRIHGVALTR